MSLVLNKTPNFNRVIAYIDSVVTAIRQWLVATGLTPYFKIVSISTLGLFLLLICTWEPKIIYIWDAGPHPKITAVQRGWALFTITTPAAYFLSIPAAFLLWLYSKRNEGTFIQRFSLTAFLISHIGFVMAAGLNFGRYQTLSACFAAVRTIAGLCVFFDMRQCIPIALRDWKHTTLALFTASISLFYNVLENQTWARVCHSTASAVYYFLHTLGLKIGVNVGIDKLHHNEPFTIISSKAFSAQIFRPCSGIEGIFLFLFLLSVIFIIDWPLFKHRRLPEIYLVGIIYMFVVNVLRISSIFALGYFAWQPDAPAFMHSFRGTPVAIFHSIAGELYDFIAFIIFAKVLYQINITNKKNVIKTENIVYFLVIKRYPIYDG